MIKKYTLFFCLVFASLKLDAQEISLNGPWSFVIDPLNRGEIAGWSEPWKLNEKDSLFLVPNFDQVIVPHCWSLDTRYAHIGKSWYRKGFKLPTDSKDNTVRLRFEAVFYKCRIFVNGNLAAYHYGGYTPFTIDVSKYVKYPDVNFLSVEVDNSWDELTIPGSRLGDSPNAQLYPWYEFGGITRDVSLIITNKIFVVNQKIEAKPDLNKGTAKLSVVTWIDNKSHSDTSVVINTVITNRTTGKKIELTGKLSGDVLLKAYSKQKIVLETELGSSDVLLWDFDNPNLYDAQTTLSVKGNKEVDQYKTYFGIREFKVDRDKVQLLLNGKPVRVAGANRASDHPVFGATDPAVLANQDMSQLRNGNMIFARLCHTPASKYFYKWADENGFLITAEIPNWQMIPVVMANQKVKDEFASQMKEFVEAYWNSPSIVAYSAGNEYSSWTPEGDEWTRYQLEKYRELDPTRLMTFVAIGTAVNPANLKLPHDSFRYCDFLNFNNYSDAKGLERNFKLLHEKYPNLPIFISEFGKRSDQVKNEEERVSHLKDVIQVINNSPYVVGASYWTHTDYLSRYANTNANGYRPWGLVDQNRKPRALYKAFQTALSPVTINVQGNKITITSNSGYPSYAITNHTLKILDGEKIVSIYKLKDLNPGDSEQITASKISKKSRLVIENKMGARIYDSENR